MSAYPAHPLAKLDTQNEERPSFASEENPYVSQPGYPTNLPGIGFNNPNLGYPTQPPPSYPGLPGYPNQPGHQANQPGYPDYTVQPSYPNPPGYSADVYPPHPDQQPGYPGQQPGYPGQQPGYPGQQPGYPGQQPGYPGQQPGYPGQQPGYPGQQPGYPGQQPGYPGQQPGYPGQQPEFPGLDPRGFVPLKPIGGKETDGDVTNPILSSGDGGEGGNINVGSSFSDKKIRHAFVKKVYLILSAQLLCTLAFVAVFILSPNVKEWVLQNIWFYWTSYVVFIITYFMLACPCCMAIRRKWPWNFICLALFTFAMSYMTGTISCFYKTDIVLIALAVTTGVCIAISIFAIQTKIDFTLCHGVLFVFSIVFFLFGIACLIVFRLWGQNYILQVVYGSIGALMFSLFLLVDTQTIIGGSNRKYQISPEEYIFGALQLYLDIVNLFLMLLRVIGTKKN